MPHATLPTVKYPLHFVNNKNFTENASVIFLHHATGSSFDWRDQMEVFSKEFNCIAYDRLGFGHSIDNESMMELFPVDYYEQSVLELADLITVLKLERVILIGHSDGATIALLGASGQKSSMSHNRVSQEALSFVKQKTVALVAEAPHVWYDNTALNDGFKLFKSTVEKTDRFWNSTDKEHKGSRVLAEKVVKRWQIMWLNNQEITKYDDRPTLDHIECPSLLIHGAKDPFFMPEHTKYIADRIGARNVPTEYELIQEAGHTPHREAKPLYNSIVLGFLRKYRPLLMRAV